MSKKKSSRSKSAAASRTEQSEKPLDKDRNATPSNEKPTPHVPSSAAIRETIESVVVAFVLAFLFRTFEAEAFVIPTGSMAPTLMGRHKDLECSNCGYKFQVSSSDEVDGNGTRRGADFLVVGCTCPMCRFPMDLVNLRIDAADPLDEYPSYTGDRILVDKFSYQFGDPARWDVVVFKYPGQAEINYIKRLVGLPGETIRIMRGDIYVKSKGDDDFVIARKENPDKMVAMLQPVFDNRMMPKIVEQGWPFRWSGVEVPGGDSVSGWKTDDYLTFATKENLSGEAWFRYEHRVPSLKDWSIPSREKPSDEPPGPKNGVQPPAQLITNFCAYNSRGLRKDVQHLRQETRLPPYPLPDTPNTVPHDEGHWVGDLAVECMLKVESKTGEALFELVEGGRRMQCRIDVASGKATLAISGLDGFRPVAMTGLRGPGQYELRFANCDDQLRLWVEDDEVQFDAPTTYDGSELNRLEFAPENLSPVGIGSAGAKLRVSELKVLRDAYYIALDPNSPTENGHVDFALQEDQFFTLGDNSAKSKDGRLWPRRDGTVWPPGYSALPHYVRRDLLIGKALFIYWPDTKYKIHTSWFSVPYFPNFGDMELVR